MYAFLTILLCAAVVWAMFSTWCWWLARDDARTELAKVNQNLSEAKMNCLSYERRFVSLREFVRTRFGTAGSEALQKWDYDD